jgi:hypothetical protein
VRLADFGFCFLTDARREAVRADARPEAAGRCFGMQFAGSFGT